MAGSARRPRAHPRGRRPRRGSVRLPLASALALPPLVQDDRVRARAVRLACPQGAVARADRARRAHVLPGLLGARGGQRPRFLDDARGAEGRSLRRGRSQDLDVERMARGLDLPRGAHESRRAASSRHLRSRGADRHAGDRGATLSRARWRFPLRGVPGRCRDPRREPRRRGRSRLGRAHAHTGLRAHHRGEARRARVDPRRARGAARRDGSVRRSLAAASPISEASLQAHASSRCARPTSSTGASRRAPRPRWRSSPARGSRSVWRARAVELLGLEGLTDGQLSAPLEGRLGGLYRASVGSTISGGSAEILQVVIARRGLGLR